MTSHDAWTVLLSDYLDDELPAADRAALERHLEGCGECSAVLADLSRVVARAQALDDRGPTRDLWPPIAAMIGPAPVPVTPIRSHRRRFTFSLPELAAAAVILAAASGGAAWLLRGPAGVPASVATAPSAAPTNDSVRPAGLRTPPTAEESYDAAVADLQQLLDAGRGRLDTTTVRVLEQNLAVIDSAVAQARRAVAKDPANGFLNAYLARTMRRKLDLMRQAAALTTAQS